jgi:hypothetical protein
MDVIIDERTLSAWDRRSEGKRGVITVDAFGGLAVPRGLASLRNWIIV